MQFTDSLIQAFKQYRTDVAKAVQWNHPDYTHSGVTRERARRVADARKALIARIPAKPSATALRDTRPEVLASLAPKTADQVAVQGREWAKVEAILKSGRVIEQVVMSATSVERLAAIADNVEIWAHGQGSNQPEKIAEKINGMIFDRLAEVGHPAAASAIAAREIVDGTAAWHDVLTEALTGDHSVDALGALQKSDPDGFNAYVQAAQAADPTGDVNRTLRVLDGLVASGDVKVA